MSKQPSTPPPPADVNTMTLEELQRRTEQAAALIEQAFGLLPGLVL